MKNLVQKSKYFILRGLLLIATLCIALMIILQITLVVGVNALNSGKMHDVIQTQVTAAMADSGYNATFDKLYYDPVRGFTLHNVTILDKDGTIATTDRFSLDIAFSKILMRQLNIIVNTGEVNLIRLPEAEPEEKPVPENEAFQPFEMPNLYFKTVRIFRLNIAHLNISASIAGQDLSFSPTLKARLGVGDTLTIDASILPKPSAKIGSIELPEEIEISGTFTPTTLSFALNKLFIASPDYSLTGKGDGQFTEDGQMNVTVDASYPDLKILTQENFESANVSLIIDGSFQHPKLRLDGVVIPASLKERGLSDIIIAADADDIIEKLSANIAIKTSYSKEPISLDAVLAYQEDILKLESIKGSAPFISLDGTGVLSTQNNIFDGKLSIVASDLAYYNDLISMDISGSFNTDLLLKPVNNAQGLDVIASAADIRFDDIQLGKADIALHLTDINHPWPQTADVQISNLSLSDTISFDKAQAVIKDVGNETYNLSLTGNGNAPSPVSFKGNLNLPNMMNDFPTLRDIDFATIFGKSVVYLSGALNKDAVDLKISTKNFRGSDIPATLPDTLANIWLNGEVVMSGTPATPSTKAHIVAGGIGTGQYKNLAITMDANHQDKNLSLALLGKGAGIQTLQGKTDFPLHLSLLPFAFDMDMNSPLSGDVLADINLGTLSALFLPPTQELSAGLKANATLAGTLSAPDVKGTLNLQQGEFTDTQNGIVIRAMNINSSFTKDSLVIEKLTATDGEKGRMNGQGRVGFADGGNTDLSLSMKDFHLPASNLADGMIDATFTLLNNNAGYDLNGTIDINHMNILVPETFQSKIPELNIVERKKSSTSDTPAQTISLSVKVNAPNQIFVRGWGLDAEFGGKLDITGDASAPLFDGSLESKRGRYEEFGKRFTLAHANLRFQGEIPPSPYLDIEAITQADDVTASILLAGPVKDPSITFSSTPALPQDEVLSRLLFGRDTAKITPFQAVQLAQALRRFSGEGSGGGLNPLEMLRSATGLDDISIDTDANGETNVGVGKYLTEKVYLEFEKGKAAGSGGANIQIELTPNINVQSEIGQDAQAGGGIFWKRDY